MGAEEIAVTNPEVEMVATAVSLELRATLVVTLPVDPSEKVAVAVNCCEVLPDIELFWELTGMLVIVLLLTVRPVFAITERLVKQCEQLLIPKRLVFVSSLCCSWRRRQRSYTNRLLPSAEMACVCYTHLVTLKEVTWTFTP